MRILSIFPDKISYEINIDLDFGSKEVTIHVKTKENKSLHTCSVVDISSS